MTIKIGGHGREEAATSTMGAIRKATESNQLRLQTLELAVAHLTNICIGLSEDVRSILLESNRIRGEDKEAVIEMKLPYYSNSSSLCSDSKDDLGTKRVKRQPWNKDTKAIPLIKVQGRKSQAVTVKANPKAPTKAAAKTSQKGSAKAGFVKKTAPAKLKPPTAAMIAKASAQVKTDSTREGLKKPANRDVPVNVKGGGRTVKLPPQMADAPTIRTLIYGSRTVMKKHA